MIVKVIFRHVSISHSVMEETLINVWSQIETVRRGFKTHKCRLNHLKLFQITNYLKKPISSSIQQQIRERAQFFC